MLARVSQPLSLSLSLSLTLSLSLHSSLSSIVSGKSSRLNPASVQGCGRWVLVSHPTLARPCEETHWRTSLMSSSLFLQQCPVCLFCLIWMVLEMGGKWPYSCYFVECYFKDLFNIAYSIFVQVPSSFCSIRLVSVHVVHYIVELTRPMLGKNWILCYRISLTSITYQ